MWYWNQGMGWWMMFGGVWLLLFLVGIVILVVWVIKRVSGSGSSTAGRRDSLDIAKERYARGEITKEEFEQLKKDLS